MEPALDGDPVNAVRRRSLTTLSVKNECKFVLKRHYGVFMQIVGGF